MGRATQAECRALHGNASTWGIARCAYCWAVCRNAQATLVPLEAELEKLELLMAGVQELGRG